ncbi:septal ring lytic transglycosylase RlpA family protein [Pontixanthobacter aestiaquae]|nr:septal ring lytic transglycosylase RlpA family protein [Pontixanthobacter aestiaquae]MDN3645083.1 septal ring lytic transglycosylase RlpA family protein [Pontixanthobacter aestiaquae]
MFKFNTSGKHHVALAALVAALTLPVAGSALAEEVAMSAETDFAESFETFEELPDMPEPQGDVVDITEIEPPIEVEIVPETQSLGTGVASYYGKRFHGRRTANGERFNMNAMTAAHKTLPFGTKVRVTNPRNGKSVVVRINDRGPFIRGRTIDLSRAAAKKVGIVQRGHGTVELAKVTS